MNACLRPSSNVGSLRAFGANPLSIPTLALVLALAGCGDDDRPSFDSGLADTGEPTDAHSVDAPLPLDAEPEDAPMPLDAGSDAGTDPEDDAGTDAGTDAGATCGNGAVDSGETCDPGVDACCNDTCDGPAAADTVCRAAAGACDVEETCDGTATACPADVLSAADTVCRAAAGGCDVEETCTGADAACPADVLSPSTTVCRTSAGDCDVEESCTGAGAACPADTFAASSTECRASTGDCDPAEMCTGSAADCPADVLASSSTVCRAAADACDAAETCDGVSAACPADGLLAGGTVCRAAVYDCDVDETCSGTDITCPADAYDPALTSCADCGTGTCLGCFAGMCLDQGTYPIYFSEYVEGSSNNKALELYSPTGLDLSLCTIRRYTNGSTTSADLPLSGTLAAGYTFVVCNPSIADASACDMTSATINHNGDDAYDLFCDGAVVDTFGRIGEDPGTEWTGGGLSTVDRTLRRKCTVTTGDTDGSDPFDPSVEYDGAPTNDLTDLGNYTCP